MRLVVLEKVLVVKGLGECWLLIQTVVRLKVPLVEVGSPGDLSDEGDPDCEKAEMAFG